MLQGWFIHLCWMRICSTDFGDLFCLLLNWLEVVREYPQTSAIAGRER